MEIIGGYPDGAGFDPDHLGQRPVHFLSDRILSQPGVLARLAKFRPETTTLDERTGT